MSAPYRWPQVGPYGSTARLEYSQRTAGADNAALMPEGRRVINGRTHSQTWRPQAVEHYRRAGTSTASRVARIALCFVACVAIGLLMGRALS